MHGSLLTLRARPKTLLGKGGYVGRDIRTWEYESKVEFSIMCSVTGMVVVS
jgi:hypothetical protein